MTTNKSVFFYKIYFLFNIVQTKNILCTLRGLYCKQHAYRYTETNEKTRTEMFALVFRNNLRSLLALQIASGSLAFQ